MASVRVRKETGHLFFDFRWNQKRCREQTELLDTAANRKRLQSVLDRIEFEIRQGTFEYKRYFPNSPHAMAEASAVQRAPLANAISQVTHGQSPVPVECFGTFVQTWLGENEVRWRRTTKALRGDMIRQHLLPRFGQAPLNTISRANLLEFRAALAKLPGRQADGCVSPKTVNEIMALLITILAEAADRFGFVNPGQGIKRLKVPRKDIQPFSLDEALRIIAAARKDYRPYFVVRFFTGMRSGEVHGLKWRYVDFERRQILVRGSFTHGEQDGIKTDGSMREITMSQQVYDALKMQETLTRHLGDYVFCTRNALPIDVQNFVSRIWNPLLDHLGLERRRPYQMRHTAATLWLASGENPEWIARQLGHSTTEMLFRVYSRFVPNLTRNDGSAFERMLTANQTKIAEAANEHDPV